MSRLFMILYVSLMFVTLLVIATGCAGTKPTPTPPIVQVGIDPTISWTAPTTDCTGAPLTGNITYNVYIVSGAPVPTITTATTDIPCGSVVIADRSKVSPVNTTPITTPTYATTLGNGIYTVGVEAVTSAGTVSGLTQKTFQVVLRSSPITNVIVGSLNGGMYERASETLPATEEEASWLGHRPVSLVGGR